MRDDALTSDELFKVIEQRLAHVQAFLAFAAHHEREASRTGELHRSLRLENRPDIPAARSACELFSDPWWAITVYTCFGSVRGARAVAGTFHHPLPLPEAESALAAIAFPRGAVGHHRIQPGHKGARVALLAACDHAELFHEVLTGRGTFEERYARVRTGRVPQWGRTTSFDLVLRGGALGVSGENYRPATAFLEGSTGPRKGFERIFGVNLDETGAGWGEALLRSWSARWSEVADRAGVAWKGAPYDSGDFENALCIYQERDPT